MKTTVDVGKHPMNYMMVQHCQSVWEFMYCTGGSGAIRFDQDQQLEFSKGVILAIPPNLKHMLVTKGGFTNLYIRIHNTALYQKRPFVFSDNREGLVLNAFQAAYLHFMEKSDTTHFILRAYSYLIITYAKCFRKEQIRNENVKDILENIHQNYANAHYELDKYLESLPFSMDYIRKLFKGETGVTPHRYLSDLRLTEAEGLLNLQGKEANITEIARRCGFREPLYFSRMFKKKYGRSPSHYAEENSNAGRDAEINPPADDA